MFFSKNVSILILNVSADCLVLHFSVGYSVHILKYDSGLAEVRQLKHMVKMKEIS